ncbi:MAG: hypothetical protein U9Q15_02015 [Patescibacteria group bacterium]|nr:hypothetical protein [Patescibacteria group bacterium]
MLSQRNIVSFEPKGLNFQFLNSYTQKTKQKKSEVLNQALDLYRKEKLRRDLQEQFSAQTQEDLDLANAGLDDYLCIIDGK